MAITNTPSEARYGTYNLEKTAERIKALLDIVENLSEGSGMSSGTASVTATIADGSVTTAKLADSAVTMDKLSSDVKSAMSGGTGSGVTVDTALDAASANPVTNAAITAGLANKVDNTQYASTSQAGIVKLYSSSGTNRSGLNVQSDGSILANVSSDYGLTRSGDGKLVTAPATTAEVEAGTQSYKPITPATLKPLADRVTSVEETVSSMGSSGGSSVTVDTSLSSTSTNPVQNKVIAAALDSKQNASFSSNGYANIDEITDNVKAMYDATYSNGYAGMEEIVTSMAHLVRPGMGYGTCSGRASNSGECSVTLSGYTNAPTEGMCLWVKFNSNIVGTGSMLTCLMIKVAGQSNTVSSSSSSVETMYDSSTTYFDAGEIALFRLATVSSNLVWVLEQRHIEGGSSSSGSSGSGSSSGSGTTYTGAAPITVSGSTIGINIDTAFSSTSTNPVQNKAVYSAVSSAASNASTALSTANTAKTTADTAKTTAEAAQAAVDAIINDSTASDTTTYSSSKIESITGDVDKLGKNIFDPASLPSSTLYMADSATLTLTNDETGAIHLYSIPTAEGKTYYVENVEFVLYALNPVTECAAGDPVDDYNSFGNESYSGTFTVPDCSFGTYDYMFIQVAPNVSAEDVVVREITGSDIVDTVNGIMDDISDVKTVIGNTNRIGENIYNPIETSAKYVNVVDGSPVIATDTTTDIVRMRAVSAEEGKTYYVENSAYVLFSYSTLSGWLDGDMPSDGEYVSLGTSGSGTVTVPVSTIEEEAFKYRYIFVDPLDQSKEIIVREVDADVVSAVNRVSDDLNTRSTYSTTPVRVGTWIDGTPVWRATFDYNFETYDYEDIKIGSFSIFPYTIDTLVTSQNKCFVTDYYAAIKAYQTPCRVDDIVITLKSLGDINESISTIDNYTGMYGWIEFVTPESNFKMS